MGKIKNIKWEKGLLRIWAIGSVGWVLLITWFYIEDRKDAYGSAFSRKKNIFKHLNFIEVIL